MTSNPQMPGRAGTSFTNIIYTKLATFSSRKIYAIIRPFSTPSNKISNSSFKKGPIPNWYRPRNGLKTTISLCPCGHTLWLRLHHYIKPTSGPKEHNSSEQSSRPDSGFPQSRTAMLLIVPKVTSLILRQSLVVDTNVIHYAVEVVLGGREGLTTNHKRSW